jgi:hypothetical protein
MCATVSWGAHESFMHPIFVLKNGCDMTHLHFRKRWPPSSPPLLHIMQRSSSTLTPLCFRFERTAKQLWAKHHKKISVYSALAYSRSCSTPFQLRLQAYYLIISTSTCISKSIYLENSKSLIIWNEGITSN